MVGKSVDYWFNLVKPKGVTLYSNKPCDVINTVLGLSSSLMGSARTQRVNQGMWINTYGQGN
jgi:hypothetical protein